MAVQIDELAKYITKLSDESTANTAGTKEMLWNTHLCFAEKVLILLTHLEWMMTNLLIKLQCLIYKKLTLPL